jgi:hypothetical protein
VYKLEPVALVVVMLLEAALAGLVPPGVAAVTVNVYEVTGESPVTVIGDEAPLPVTPPGDEVAVYVTVPAPKSVGAVKATVAVDDPVAVAVPMVGVPGLLGQTLAPTDCICWETVQIPFAVLVEVVGAVVEITPPL